MNTMTLDDVLKEAESRDAAISLYSSSFDSKRPIVFFRPSDVPRGLGDRGILRLSAFSSVNYRLFRISAIQQMRFCDISDAEMNMLSTHFRDWGDFVESLNEMYEHFSTSEIISLVWIGEEIIL